MRCSSMASAASSQLPRWAVKKIAGRSRVSKARIPGATTQSRPAPRRPLAMSSRCAYSAIQAPKLVQDASDQSSRFRRIEIGKRDGVIAPQMPAFLLPGAHLPQNPAAHRGCLVPAATAATARWPGPSIRTRNPRECVAPRASAASGALLDLRILTVPRGSPWAVRGWIFGGRIRSCRYPEPCYQMAWAGMFAHGRARGQDSRVAACGRAARGTGVDTPPASGLGNGRCALFAVTSQLDMLPVQLRIRRRGIPIRKYPTARAEVDLPWEHVHLRSRSDCRR